MNPGSCSTLLLTAFLLLSPSPRAEAASVPDVAAARGVLQRFIGPRASDFVLGSLPPRPDGRPAYELCAEGGKVNGHDGPLPDSWHGRTVALQKKILARMRALGIEPIGPAFEEGVKKFLAGARKCPAGALLRNDAIEFAVQYAGVQVDRRMEDGLAALEAGEKETADACMDQAFRMLDRIDALLASHTLFRLDRWVAMARACGDTAAEKDYYEEDAKRQITVWGGPMLSEYAAKVWSGLVGGYYTARWRAWYEAERAGNPFDLHAWEERWITTPGGRPDTTSAGPVARSTANRGREFHVEGGIRQETPPR